MNYPLVSKLTSYLLTLLCFIFIAAFSEKGHAQSSLLIRGNATITVSQGAELDVNCREIIIQGSGVFNLNGGTIVNQSSVIEAGEFNNVGGTIESCLPTLDKEYLNRAVFPGQDSRVFYSIRNLTDSTVTGVAFSDVLDVEIPSGLIVSNTPSITNSCGGTLTASPGSSTVSLSDASLAPGVCRIALNVTAVTAGFYDVSTSDLSSNLGAGNAAQANLEVLSLTDARVPLFSTQISPSITQVGDLSGPRITYTIDNRDGPIIQNLNFLNTLPSGVSVSSTPNATTDCFARGGAVFNVVANANQIEVDNYAIPSNSRCSFSVNITPTSVGTIVNTTGDLTSDAGNSGSATSVLTVLPGFEDVLFSAAFLPATINAGERSTLTYTIDNTMNTEAVSTITFDVELPLGTRIASPSNASSDCGGSNPMLTAEVGADSFSFSSFGFNFPGFEVLTAGASCVVTVDVEVNEPVDVELSGVVLAVDGPDVGFATAVLNVNPNANLQIDKFFATNSVAPGATAIVSYELTNNDAERDVSDVGFSDDVSLILPGATFTSVIQNSCGGTTQTGSSEFELSGVTISSLSNCVVSLGLSVPQSVVNGSFVTTTSAISGEFEGVPVTGNSAVEILFVSTAPLLTTQFTSATALNGEPIVLEYMLTNPSPTSEAMGINFVTNLSGPLGVATVLPDTGDCGVGSNFTFSPFVDTGFGQTPAMVSIVGASLGIGESCTFTVMFDTVDANSAIEAVTSAPTAMVDGLQQTGQISVAQIDVVGGLSLTANFLEETVVPGSNTTLAFELRYFEDAETDITDIAFTYDFDALVAGATAIIPPSLEASCGDNVALSLSLESSLLSVENAALSAGEVCSFSVAVNIPVGVSNGAVQNSSSDVSAMIGAETVTFAAAETELIISPLVFTSRFLQDSVVPGQLATLEYTIDNQGINDATSITFTSALSSVVSGLSAIGPLPTNSCGASSTLTGTTFLIFVSGSLAAGDSCTFQVLVQVPSGASNGDFTSITSPLSATIDGGASVLNAASTVLSVDSNQVSVSHSFDATSVAPGETVNIEYQLTNLNSSTGLTSIDLTHDLSEITSGLTVLGLPENDVCGNGSSLTSSGDLIVLTDGALAASQACVFSVSVIVPLDAQLGVFESEISSISGATTGGLAAIRSLDSLSELVIQSNDIDFTKSFSTSPVNNGGETQLTYTIVNNSADDMDALRFTDALDGVISGLVSTSSSQLGVCGVGSQLGGTSQVVFTGGVLAAGQSCSFSVTVLVPLTAGAGEFETVSSELLSNALFVAKPAQTSLMVTLQPPVLSFDFAPSTVLVDGVSNLTFTVNASSTVSDLLFGVSLPFGLEVANPINGMQDCGGSLTTEIGATLISFMGGEVLSGESCAISLDVKATMPGEFNVITTALNSSIGMGAAAQGTFNVLSDTDQDGVADINDNCPAMPNPDQANLDNDALGDVCDPDDDDDGLPDSYEIANGLDPLDASDRTEDLDDDGFNNFQEFEFGTDPTVPNDDDNNNSVPDVIDRQRSLVPTIIVPLLLELEEEVPSIPMM